LAAGNTHPITPLTVEDIITVKSRRENMSCEFCEQPSEYELKAFIQGRESFVLICGQCGPSRIIMDFSRNGKKQSTIKRPKENQ